MAASFNIGDIVQLKSGGPEMTVDSLFAGQVFCKWFVGDDLKTETFSPGALKLVRAAE
ncbi:YodC family protein [Sphingomonas sp.]|jgi:uncharacterized protein YodC (DUF2158 family)|uniref:YodC family protein n=1 Tax=Sphingomonas sp. TaxID=28214 RepID=UPI002EDB3E9B